MLSFEEALAQLLAFARPTPHSESLALLNAPGRVLSAAVLASMNVPPADNSAMDGYAVRSADVVGSDQILAVTQRVPAGIAPQALLPGTAARIFTGAEIPFGADAVVMQERCVAEGEGVRFEQLARAGDNIRRAGEDIALGASVLSAGCLLSAAQIGLAASLGVAELSVFRRLRVAVFFTGDELVMPGQALQAGQIYNSNRFVLSALLAQMGCELSDLGIVPDALDATRQALRQAAQDNDVVLTCGGVSVGEEDHVKAAVEAEGSLHSWKVAIKPGKPFAYGRIGEADFIGLPGNPVSAFVTFMVLVAPYLRKRQGRLDYVAPMQRMRADFAWAKTDPRREFLRVRRNAQGGLDLFPRQGSGVLSSCAWADGLVDCPPNTQIEPGQWVEYRAMGAL